MTDQSTDADSSQTTWRQKEDSVFFKLSPSKLATTLKKAIGKHADTDKDIYLDALLLNVAHTATGVMEQEARLNGDGLAARMQSPASSIARVGKYENAVYDLIDKGDVDAVKSIVKPQTMTFTAHPNFSRSSDLVRLSNALATELGKLNRDDQQKIIDGELPDNQTIKDLLSEIKDNVKLRTKRTRAEELKETTLDMIPTVLDAATEQVRIYKARKHELRGTKGDETADFNNLKQLEAVAALLPEYNSWFLDGDGKRTVHAYDAELAVPAIKRVTYEAYEKSLETLKEVEGIKPLQENLQQTITVLKDVEKLATARMNAYNTLQVVFDEKNTSRNIDVKSRYKTAHHKAVECSLAYENYIHTKPDGEHTVIELMARDDANNIKNAVTKLLTEEYAAPKLDKNVRGTAEDLYIKLARYGNFAAHIQRRENAQQYNETLLYLIQNDHDIKEAVVSGLQAIGDGTANIDMRNVMRRLSNPQVFGKAIDVFAGLVADPNGLGKDMFEDGRGGVKRNFLRHYTELKNKLASQDEELQERIIQPLERRELLALDDLGMFRVASLYPEAFKGGFVIAEFGQPDIDNLRDHSSQEVEAEVKRIAKNDMTLQMAFANAMGAPNVEIIPLHEDPSTMQHAAAAQASIRTHPVVDYMLKWLDIAKDDSSAADKKALHYIDDAGKVQTLNAYQYMQQMGFGDDELKQRGLDKAKLQQTSVLEGPHDMEACSDNNKRAGIMGSVLADQSVRDKVAAAAGLPVTIGEKDYIIVKPKYLGQGGSIARATQVPIDTVQATWQGEHTLSFTPASLAHKSYNTMLGRLFMREEAARAIVPQETTEQGQHGHGQSIANIAEKYPHIGNILGLPGAALLTDERAVLMKAIEARLESTRDDPSYNNFLTKYGEPVSNWSARSDAKGGATSGALFNEGRAIGIAGLESGIFSNIISFAEIFTPLKGEGDKAIIERLQQWRKKDPMVQQLVAGASLTANFVDLKEKWKRGGIEYSEERGVPMLHKMKRVGKNQGADATVSLQTLVDAYDAKNGDKNFTDSHSGIVFDAADLVMAHLTDQYHRMVKGLEKLHKTTNKIEFVPEAHREDVQHFADLNTKVLHRWHETKDNRRIGADPEQEYPELKDVGKLALDAYYLLHESGTVYPMPALLEESIYQEARQRSEQAVAA